MSGVVEADGDDRRWLQLCNGRLPGNVVGPATAAWCASQPGVQSSLDTELRWTVPALKRTFTLTPLAPEDERA